jgi:peptidyl-dipeptidase A
MRPSIAFMLAGVLLFTIGCGGKGKSGGEAGSAGVSETGSGQAGTALSKEVDSFINDYAREYQRLYYDWNKAEWASNTHIVEGDTTNAARTRQAHEAWVRFVGSVDNIQRIRAYLEKRDQLAPLQTRVLQQMLYEAAEGPQTIPEVVKKRIDAETKQTEDLYGFDYKLHGKEITPNGISDLLRTSNDLEERRAVWESSEEVGPVLEPGIMRLRDLRNETVQALGYSDFFQYQVSDYGMTVDEMLNLNDELVKDVWPLYRELHTWARYELADRYGVPVPDMIPADWLPNRWGQEWTAMAESEGVDLDEALKAHTAEWVCQQGEAFYVSLGFDKLPESFWELSSLYPVPPDAGYKKNTHASAWHMDLDKDVRSLMSVEPNSDWYGTVHHELGHIYYYMSYSNPNVPLLLRRGANRAYHEGIGTMIELAAGQRRFLADRGLVPAEGEGDQIGQLLKEALDHIVFIPWGAGVMTRFEYLLYAKDLPPEVFNKTWWDLVKRYQGIVPPYPRGEEYADALSKTHISDDPAQYYDYALAEALLFQLHVYVAREILHQDPHDTDYYGSVELGNFLRDIMSPGASRPWQEVLQETTGQGLNAKAMMDYFQPLYDWLVQQNKGRTYTLPEMQ